MANEFSITSKDDLSEDEIKKIKSYFSDIAEGVVCGMGTKGYEFALEKAINSN